MANVLLYASADGYAFRHALIREAVNGDLLPGEDERQHARYAATIDANPSLAGPGRAAIEAAHHWYWSGDRMRALSGAWQAADQLGAIGRVRRAAGLARPGAPVVGPGTGRRPAHRHRPGPGCWNGDAGRGAGR